MPEPTDAEVEIYGPAEVDLLEPGITSRERERRYRRARERMMQPITEIDVPHHLRRWDKLAAVDPEFLDPDQRVLGLKRIAARLYNFYRKSGPASPNANVPHFILDDLPRCTIGSMSTRHVRKLWRNDKNVRRFIRKSDRYYLATIEGIGQVNDYLWRQVHAPAAVAARKRRAVSARRRATSGQ